MLYCSLIIWIHSLVLCAPSFVKWRWWCWLLCSVGWRWNEQCNPSMPYTVASCHKHRDALPRPLQRQTCSPASSCFRITAESHHLRSHLFWDCRISWLTEAGVERHGRLELMQYSSDGNTCTQALQLELSWTVSILGEGTGEGNERWERAQS